MKSSELNDALKYLPTTVTLVGAALSLKGLVELKKGKTQESLRDLALGRACDLLDGFLARKLGAESRWGKIIDPAVDKALAGTSIAVLWRRSMISDSEALALIASNAMSIGTASIEAEVTQAGKIGTFAQWAGQIASIAAETDWADKSAVQQEGFKQTQKLLILGGSALVGAGAIQTARRK